MKPDDVPESLLNASTAGEGQAPVRDAAQSRTLMDGSQTGLFVVQDNLIVYANPMAAAMVGWNVAELVGQVHEVMVAPEYRAHANASVERRLAGKSGRPGDVGCLRRDGSTFDARVFARRIDFEGRPAVLVTILDISELKQAVRRAEWNAGMLARTEALCRAGSFELDAGSGQLTISAGLRNLLGRGEAAPTEPCTIDTVDWVPQDEQGYVAGIWRNAVAGEPFEFQHRMLLADGTRRVVVHRGQLDTDGRGVALLQDVTERVEAEQRIQDLATHHEITGLPNRPWMLDQIEAAMQASRWEPEPRALALLAIDLPRIAEIKANMGFGAGDTLCMALAARLREKCNNGEQVAQLGETEFAVLFELASDTPRETLRQRAEALQQHLQAPVRLGATDVFAQCQIGIAAFPEHAEAADRLLECAQTARMDIALSQGVAFFRPESAERALREMAIESALWRALDSDELELHFQPQVDLLSGGIVGAEALLRWTSAELGKVSPAEFVPVAERSGLIGAIGDWVLDRACRYIGKWRRAGLPVLRVSVNLAPVQLQRPDLAARLQERLLEVGADAGWLGIEITEGMVMSDLEGVSAVLRAIKALGIQISLDDFGTGY